MERRRNTGFTGTGYNFKEEERDKIKEFRKELSKAYGFGGEENEDDENLDMGKNASKKEEERKR